MLEGGSHQVCDEHLDELALLADTAGYEVVGRVVQDRARPEAATLIGKGKVEEIRQRILEMNAVGVIVDDDLAPQQAVKLEKAWGVAVTDRAGLILEIFASRARTREARTQVELASLRYTLPRLARRWTHLSRQVGGIGVRGGVGETQIEIDRRLIRQRIGRLKRELVRIQKRRGRERNGSRALFTAALVGYTNSGKSTLFNRLTASAAAVENRLFVTLDPLRRALADDSRLTTVLIDTVGFIRKLPHHLVASFRSTLEEAGDADLLVQVVDISDPHMEEKMHTTDEVLQELDLAERPRLLVFNKSDLLDDPAAETRILRHHPDGLIVSARTGVGLDALGERLRTARSANEVENCVEIDPADSDALSMLHRHGRVMEVSENGTRIRVRYRASRAAAGRILRGLGAHGVEVHV